MFFQYFPWLICTSDLYYVPHPNLFGYCTLFSGNLFFKYTSLWNQTPLFKDRVISRGQLSSIFQEGGKDNFGVQACAGMEYRKFLLLGQKNIATGLGSEPHLSHCVLVQSTKCYYRITHLSSPRTRSWNPNPSAASKLTLWPFHFFHGHLCLIPHWQHLALVLC